VKELAQNLRALTGDFMQVPASEKKQEQMLELLRQYNAGMAKLKQYDPQTVDGETTGFDYENPDQLIEALGMSSAEEIMLTTVLSNELKERVSETKKVPVYQIELKMTHVKDVKIDYDYLTELLENLLNQVHEKKIDQAKETRAKIGLFAKGLDDRNYARRIDDAADAIVKGHYKAKTYPVKLSESETIIQEASQVTLERIFQDFRIKWGIIDIISSSEMRELFSRHRLGQQDLDDNGQIRDVIASASNDYKTLAHDEKVTALSRIKYRNGLREAIYQLADALAEN
jgi:type I restriction enzyme R subunit